MLAGIHFDARRLFQPNALIEFGLSIAQIGRRNRYEGILLCGSKYQARHPEYQGRRLRYTR